MRPISMRPTKGSARSSPATFSMFNSLLLQFDQLFIESDTSAEFNMVKNNRTSQPILIKDKLERKSKCEILFAFQVQIYVGLYLVLIAKLQIKPK